MFYTNYYVINWNKVKTKKDIIRILKKMDISFEQDNRGIEDLTKYVVKQSKVILD